MAEETVLLRVQLDENKTTDRLKQLVLDIEKTKLAQQALNKARKDNAVDDATYSRQALELSQQLKTQRTEQSALTKNLELYRGAVDGVAGSYDQMQSQLTLAQRQYRALADSATDSSEETKALSGVIRELRGQLKQVDASSLDQHFREVGNYKGAFQDLVQELAKLRVEEKGLAEGSKELAQNQARQVGFLTAAQRAAAESGKTYNEASKAIENYAKQIEPATEQLVKLEQAQARLVESGEEASEAFRKIGFQISQAGKQIKEVPVETKKVSDRITELDATTGAFGGRISGLKESFTAAKGGFDVATKGLSGVRVAMLAVPIFAIIAGLTALYAWFTKTQAGADFVERKMKGLSVAFGVVTDKVSAVGEMMVKAFDNPKQALTDLVSFIATKLLNSLKGYGVVLDGILSLDTRKMADGFIQIGTGITDATSKAQGLSKELLAAADAGEQIAAEFQRIRDAERQINVERAQAKKDIEALKLVAEDVSKSTVERLNATRDAFALEQKSANAQLQAQRDRVANMEQEAKLTNQMAEQSDALAEERIKLAELEEGSLTRQIELNNKLNELRQQATERALADTKAYYERLALQAEKGSQAELAARLGVIRAEREAQLAAQGLTENQRRLIVAQSEQAIRELRQSFRQAELQAQLGNLDLQLQQVQKNSDEETNLLVRRLATQHRLELAQANLTVAQRELINRKYEADLKKLEQDSVRARAAVLLQNEINNTTARLAAVRQGSEQELALQKQAIEQQRQQQLAAIDARIQGEERASQQRAINARADQQLDELTYQSRLKAIQTFYQQQRNELDQDKANGKLTEQQYALDLFQQEIGFLSARRTLNQNYNRDTAVDDQELTDKRIANLKRLTDKEREVAQQRAQITQDLASLVGQFFAESTDSAGQALENFARKAILVLIESVEKAILAAQIEILVKSFKEADSIATFGATGGIRAALIIAGVTAATAPLKAALAAPSSGSKFAQGTVLGGASHANGGVQLYNRYTGQHIGEAEGDEVILTKGVWRNPLLRPMASMLNVMGGGKALIPSRFMALGGVTSSALVRESLSGTAATIDYDKLAQATAKALQQNPPINRWQDWKDAKTRNDFTDRLGAD